MGLTFSLYIPLDVPRICVQPTVRSHVAHKPQVSSNSHDLRHPPAVYLCQTHTHTNSYT